MRIIVPHIPYGKGIHAMTLLNSSSLSCYTYCMKTRKGSSVIIGLVCGLILGVVMENLISFLFLGLMFGLIGEMANKKKTDE